LLEALGKGFNAKAQRRKEEQEVKQKCVKYCLDNDLGSFFSFVSLRLCAFALKPLSKASKNLYVKVCLRLVR
jgi:hypothetical protein